MTCAPARIACVPDRMRNRTLSQPFHVPCQRPLQALAEQSTDWEASLKSLDSSLKVSRERAALQFQVLGHEVAGLGCWGLATKHPGHTGQGYTHRLKAFLQPKRECPPRKKKSSRKGRTWVYHWGTLELQHPSADLWAGMEQPRARSYGATTAGEEAAASLALVLLIVFAKKRQGYF